MRARTAAGVRVTEEGAVAPAPPPPRTPPSQTQFAAGVARQVVKDLVPGPLRYALFGVAVILALLLLWMLLG